MLEREIVEREEEQQGEEEIACEGGQQGEGKKLSYLSTEWAEKREDRERQLCAEERQLVWEEGSGSEGITWGRWEAGSDCVGRKKLGAALAKPTCLTGTGTKGRLSLVYSTYPRGSETNTRVKSGETSEHKPSEFCVEVNK